MNPADRPAPIVSPDVDVVHAMSRGEEQAAAMLYDRHAAAMYGLALRLVGEPADAEDVVLDAFSQAWREAATFDGQSGSVAEWLTVVTRTRALERMRARSGQATVTDALGQDAAPFPGVARALPPWPSSSLRDRVQARIAVEAGTQNAAQVAGDVASRVTTPTSTAPVAAGAPRAPNALDEIRARINAANAEAGEAARGGNRAAAGVHGDALPASGPAVTRTSPGSRAVRVTPPRSAAGVNDPVRRRPSRAGWYVAAVVAAGLAATASFALDLRTRVGVLESGAREKTAQVTRLEKKLNEKERTLATLLAGRGNVVLVNLDATAPTGPGMQLFWNVRDGKAVVNAYGLAQIASDRAYMLWMIRDTTPVPVTLFTPDETGRALVADVDVPNTTTGVTLFTVTEESAQGAQAPTMTPFLTGVVPGAK